MKNLILKFGVLALCAAIMASCVACGENTSNEQMQNGNRIKISDDGYMISTWKRIPNITAMRSNG